MRRVSRHRRRPFSLPLMIRLLTVYGYLNISAGREDEAIAAAEEELRREFSYSFVKGLKRNPFKDQAYVEYLTDLYHKAGLK